MKVYKVDGIKALIFAIIIIAIILIILVAVLNLIIFLLPAIIVVGVIFWLISYFKKNQKTKPKKKDYIDVEYKVK